MGSGGAKGWRDGPEKPQPKRGEPGPSRGNMFRYQRLVKIEMLVLICCFIFVARWRMIGRRRLTASN